MPTNLIPNYAIVVSNTVPQPVAVAMTHAANPTLLVGGGGTQGPSGPPASFITIAKWGTD